MTILELREKPNKAWEAAKAFVETKRDKDGLLSDEDANTYASDVLSEGIDENGGYLVPEEYDSRLIDVLTEENIFRGLANVITTSGQHKINIAGAKPAAARI
ncbi:phage major capsid protein [Lachnotalea sp. AF33-28]|uniref:phage major capsid protein n=1 Tax=Lachnotalea sp. AF33-28 TaxID=2292046 RepID=UPI0026B725FB|nr:phage major capsid protein [Lachnotalea sp. AF33-28]